MKLRNMLGFVLGLGLTALARAAAPDVLTVAILDFDSDGRNGANRNAGAQVAALLSANLSTDERLILVERAQLAKMLGEQVLGRSGAVTPDSAAQLGKLTGAKILVTGRVLQVGVQTVLVAKVMSTETGRVYGEMVEGPAGVSIVDLTGQLAKKVAATVTAKADTLASKTVPASDRVEKLRAGLAGKTLPVVSVKIREQHLGRSIPDPAAETELGMVLQQCGFTVVDEKSAQKPAFEISGEAFSAFGMRKGNLFSCNARVELKVREVATGSVRLIDRQTSVAVDIAEATAGKLALQTAALALAERVVPKLVE